MTSLRERRNPGGGQLFTMSNNIYCFMTILQAALLLFLLPTESSILHKRSFSRGVGPLKNHIGALEDAIQRTTPQDFMSNSLTWTTPNDTENWMPTGVRFLTKVQWDNGGFEEAENIGFGIAASDFHIVELQPEEYKAQAKPYAQVHAPETLRIHLMRKTSVLHPKMRVVVRDGDSYQNWSPSESATVNCHFVGQVTSSPKPSSATELVKGLALLSACPPSIGFSGLIIMEDGRQWYIAPVSGRVPTRRKRDIYDSDSSYAETLEHVLLPHSKLSGHLSEHVADVLRVPLPQLEEAARLAALDAEARHSGIVSQGWDDSEETLQGESSILTPFLHTGATLPFRSRTSGKVQSKVNQARKLTSSKKISSATTLLSPVETETMESSASVTSHENRSALEPRVVEIAVFTDEELFDKMKVKFKDDTTAQLKQYATSMVNMMDVMYQHSSLGVDLRFRLVYLEVMKRKPSSLKTNGGKAKAYLSSFCDYAGEKNANSAQWDHALLLTGVDLHEEGIKTTAGLAWAGTMCYRYYSCSISEALNFASAYITTHEIGHSLGMEHDGIGISESCDSSKFIMSPTTGPGKVTWSTCSSSNLQDFIKYGTSELRGKSNSARMISRPLCLEEIVARDKKSYEDSSESDLKLPGEKYDANFQCSLGMGSFFKPHFERHKPPFDNICWILYCGNGTHAISTHPALEGTPCDRKKYCRSGQCVKRPET